MSILFFEASLRESEDKCRALMENDACQRTLFDNSPIGLSIQDFCAIAAPLQMLKDSGYSVNVHTD